MSPSIMSSLENSHGGFLRLPLEIRIAIYEYLFSGNHFTLRTAIDGLQPYHHYEHQVIYCNKQVKEEATPVLHRTMVVKFESGMYLAPLGKASPMHMIGKIPSVILRTVTMAECQLDQFQAATLLKRWSKIKTVHLKDAIHDSHALLQSRMNPWVPNTAIAVTIPCQSANDMDRLVLGNFDEDIVQAQTMKFKDIHMDMSLFRLCYKRWQRYADQNCRILVTTRGCLSGPEAEKMWDTGQTMFEREITYNFETLEILGRTTVYID